MPLDPTISLGVKPLQTTGSPLDFLSSVGDTMNKLNQNRLFQQQFQAKQKAGQIIASSPDMETAFDSLTKDPQVAPFAGEIINNYRAGMLAQTQQQGELQHQATGSFMDWLKQVPGTVSNPQAFDKLSQSTLALVNPQIRGRVADAMASVRSSLTDGLPSDPQASSLELAKRFAGLATSAGISPDTFSLAAGKPGLQDLGDTLQPTMTNLATGQVTQSPGALTRGVAPRVEMTPTGQGGATVPTLLGGANARPSNALNGGPSPTGTPPSLGLLPTPTARSAAPAPMGQTQEQTAANEGAGKSIADLQSEMNTNMLALPSAMKRLDIMTGALGGFQAGGGAEMRANLGSALQAVKNAGGSFVTQDLIDKVANQNLSDTQLFNAEVKPLAISELKAAAQGTGRVMRSEVDAFLGMMDSAKDPATLTRLLNQARYSLQVGYDQTQKFNQFKHSLGKDPSLAGMTLSDFPAWYSQNFSPEAMPSATAGGLNLGPQSWTANPALHSPLSAPTAGATHIYVPGKGIQPIGGGQ